MTNRLWEKIYIISLIITMISATIFIIMLLVTAFSMSTNQRIDIDNINGAVKGLILFFAIFSIIMVLITLLSFLIFNFQISRQNECLNQKKNSFCNKINDEKNCQKKSFDFPKNKSFEVPPLIKSAKSNKMNDISSKSEVYPSDDFSSKKERNSFFFNMPSNKVIDNYASDSDTEIF